MRVLQQVSEHYLPIKEMLKREREKSGEGLEGGEAWEAVMSD
jgi:hypothetical protein